MSDELDLVSMFEGLAPPEAKELTERIRSAVQKEVENFKQPKKENKTMPVDFEQMFSGLSDEEVERLLVNLSPPEQVDLYRSLTSMNRAAPQIGKSTFEEQLASNAAKLKKMYKEPSKYREQIAAVEAELEPLYYAHDLERAKARGAAGPQLLQVGPLERQRETLLEELAKYQKFPSKYRDRMKEITTELDGIDQKIREAQA